MKTPKIDVNELQAIAKMLPKIPSGVKKVKHSVLGMHLSNSMKETVREIFKIKDIDPIQRYSWTNLVPIYMNHYDSLVRAFKKSGSSGIEEYTIKIKELHIENIRKKVENN